jgi:RNA polymerase sigma factor (sigma-70 family)
MSAAGEFPTTSWSVIRHLQDPGSPERRHQLERLVARYWQPVYAVIRYSWRKDPEDARDLAQDFFADRVLEGSLVQAFSPEQGSFRAFVRGAIRNFMLTTMRTEGRQKRGGAVPLVRLDDHLLEPPALDDRAAGLTPEELFDVAWNQMLVARAVDVARQRLERRGMSAAFEAFRRHDLAPDGPASSYQQLGNVLGLSEGQVKRALAEGRAVFRRAVTEMVREYVDGPEELARELREIFGG